MSYFILCAIADCHGIDYALDVAKQYFGGMLQRGATTFWENFDLSWLKDSGSIDQITPIGKKDLHGDYGEYCYQGFRHSLCHGWSCGAVQFLTEKVLGVNFIDCNTIDVCPDLGKLTKVDAVLPTSKGNVIFNVVRQDILTSITATLPNGKILHSQDGKLTINLN